MSEKSKTDHCFPSHHLEKKTSGYFEILTFLPILLYENNGGAFYFWGLSSRCTLLINQVCNIGERNSPLPDVRIITKILLTPKQKGSYGYFNLYYVSE